MFRNRLFIGLAVFFLSACTTHQYQKPVPLAEVRDPLEKLNRATFATNKAFDKVILRPLAKTYEATYPVQARDRVRDALQNLLEPNNFVNAVLQAKFADAGKVATRFVVNTVFGMFGLFDIAGKTYHIPYKRHNFSSTLGSWGIKRGPYLVLPLKGPSTFRDTVGFIADTAMDPINILYYTTDSVNSLPYVRTGVETIEDRARLLETTDELEKTSVDYYTSVKSAYLQHKAGDAPEDYDTMDMDSPEDELKQLGKDEPVDPDYM